jgi:CBS domain-containing protein
MNLAAILKTKGGSILSVGPATRIMDVIKVLGEKRIGALLILADDGKLEGIISERDIVRSMAVHAAGTFELSAGELMTRSPIVASPDTTVAQAMEMMTDGRFRHLPILDAGKLVGLVSIGDVVKARLMQQEHEVDSLRAYVVGAPA